MPQYFTQYWNIETLNGDLARANRELLRHTASDQFSSGRIQPGDVLYIVSMHHGKMVIASRGVVAKVVSRFEAMEILGTVDLWNAESHIIFQAGTGLPVERRVVPDDIAAQLRFFTGTNEPQPLKFRSTGRLDGQTLRSVRQLTADSAALLDLVLHVSTPHVTSSQDELDKKPVSAGSQGFQVSPAARQAIEGHAVQMAIDHFERQGFDIEVHGKPSDLYGRKGHVERYVEVKGTTQDGTSVLLTRNEVEFARSHVGHMALVVVSNIRLEQSDEANPVATGGEMTVFDPWDIDAGELTPMQYQYALPQLTPNGR